MSTETSPISAVSLPALPPSPYLSSTESSSHLDAFIALGTLITVISLILLALLILLIKRKKEELGSSVCSTVLPSCQEDLVVRPENQCKALKKGSSTTFHQFKFSEIRKATDDFSTIIGKGGFGTVYKARFHGGLIGAVKRMNIVSKFSLKEFGKEMEFLGRLHHRHLVTLKGFCVQKHERFLVYEYMENGSLKEHLQGGDSKTPLAWGTRLQIAMDVASALEYLHCYCDPPLCHGDIKSSNILLDEKFLAKVADFGLAHTAPGTASGFQQISTDVQGTPGYMDPEYLATRQLTDKSDIYSYGVLLLELITARAAVQDNVNIVEWYQRYITVESDLIKMIDPDLKCSYDLEELQSVMSLIRMCTCKEGRLRPTSQQVLRYLQDKLNTDPLQCPQVMISLDSIEKESSSYLNVSDGIENLSPYTPWSDCCQSFQFEGTPPISPILDQR